MLSYTITSASDWDSLLSQIDRQNIWTEDVTSLLISTLESIRTVTAGRFYIEVDDITYIYLIIQPPNTLIHELPLQTINARPIIPLGAYIVVGCILVGIGLYLLHRSPAHHK